MHKDEVRAFASEVASRLGDPEVMNNMTIDEFPSDKDGSVISGWRPVQPSEPGRDVSYRLPASHPHLRLEAAKMVVEAIRARRREAALVAFGLDATDNPAWSCDIHVLAKSMLQWEGVDLHLALQPPSKATGSTNALLDQVLHERRETHSLRSETTAVRAGRIEHQHIWIDSRKDEMDIDLTATHYVSLALPVPTPSATLCAALVGQPLSVALDHPALNDAGEVRITRTIPGRWATEGDSFILWLEDTRIPLAEPPPGADVSWREITLNHPALAGLLGRQPGSLVLPLRE